MAKKKNEAKIKFVADTGEYNDSITSANSKMAEMRAELKLSETQMKATGASVEYFEKRQKILQDELAESEEKTEALNQKIQKAIENFGEDSLQVTRLRTDLLKAKEAQEVIRQSIEACNKGIENQVSAAQEADTALSKLTDTIGQQENELEQLKKEYVDAVLTYGDSSDEASKLANSITELSEELKKNKNELSDAKSKADEYDRILNQVAEETQEAETELSKLTDTIDKQQRELNDLKDDYKNAVLAYGDTSDEAKKLENSISKLSGELRDNQKKINEVTNKADALGQSLDDVDENAEDAGDGFTVLGGTFADLASNAIQGAIGKIGEFTNYLSELPEATMELRQDLSTLTTSFDDVGLSADTATDTWKDLYSIFGEDDRAVETANNIAKIADNQEELNKWIDITTGAWGRHQDSLPVEGLAEAAMETAKTGSVTGVLADALNWSAKEGETFGVKLKKNIEFTKLSSKELSKLTPKQKAEYEAKKKQYEETEKYNKSLTEAKSAEEKFQFALDKCTTEEERQKLITETLNGLYSEAADTYRETSGAQMDAKEAAAENALAEAELAEAVEPVTTAFTELKTEIMKEVKPAVEAVSGVMTDALDWAREHPTAMKAVAAAFGVVAFALTGLAVAAGVYTAAQWAMTSAILANPVTWIIVGVIAVIAALVAIFVTLWNKCEGFRNFFIGAWESIKVAWEVAKPFFEILFEGIKTAVLIAADFFVAHLKNAWENIKLVWAVSVEFFKLIGNTIKDIFSVVKTFLVGAFKTAWASIKLAWAVVGGYFKAVWNTIKGVFAVVKAVLSGDFKGAWEAIKGIVSTWANYFKNIWSNIKNVFSNVKSWFSSTFSAAWSAIKNIWSNVGSFFSKVIEKVKSTFDKTKDIISKPFKSAIDKVKGFFKNLKLSFPKIKMPHFSISGKFKMDPPSVPKFSVKWYKDGAIFTKPTLFNTPFGIKGFGEAGPEAALPIDKLEGYVASAIEKNMSYTDLQPLVDKIEDMANRPIVLDINGRRFAQFTASDTDSVNGLRNSFVNRGLVLE